MEHARYEVCQVRIEVVWERKREWEEIESEYDVVMERGDGVSEIEKRRV